ncbi:MAG: PAS domain S-box protein [Desulfobacterales bacterium]|nr:PAS domain S-box protein [Desulfobacterales bacterium]
MKILLVDNDPTLLKFLPPRLEKAGHEVITASDGLQAMDILSDLTPDAILVDYIMPNVDGKTLCTVIRQNPRLSAVFIAILSAVAAEEAIDIQRLGADCCIAKGPFDRMLVNILDVLEAPKAAADRCVGGEVIGRAAVSPRRITHELLAAKKHFEMILSRMSEGILEINAQGRIVYANPAAVGFRGLSERDILGRRFAEVFGVADGSASEEALRPSAKNKEVAEGQVVLHRNDHRYGMKVIFLEEGTSAALVILTDFTEQHRAEKALAESEEKYRNVVENITVGILVAQDGRLVFANHAISRFLGKSVEELFSEEDPFGFIHPEDRSMVLGRHMRRIKGEQAPERYFFRVFDAEDRTRWVEVSCVLISWNDRPATLNFFTDVTEQLASQKALAESEGRYRHLINVAPAGIYEIDYRAPKLLSVNDLLCEYSGYSRQELLEMNPLDLLTEESQQHYLARLEGLAEKQQISDTVEYEGIRKNGERVLFRLSANYHYEEGQIARATCVVHDITELRKVEEEKKRLERQLQQAQKLEALGTLAGGVSHDFNNLLMGIQARISLMLMQVEPSHPFYRHLKTIEQYIENGAGLTKQVLGFARRGKYHVQSTDMNEMVRQSVSMFGRTKKEITIHLDLDEALPPAMVDRSQIQQMLLNLYVNAWQAMDGAGELTLISKEAVVGNKEASYGDLEPGRYVEVRVSDNGPGIDPAIHQRIFDPFFTTKERGRGTGLGLASAYGIAKSHGGSISVESEPGKGAVFVIRLPATEDAVVKETIACDEAATGNETILLVDDEEIVLESGRELLQKLGYKVITAENGQQALDAFRRKKGLVDLVILDMIMPAMSGGEVFDQLRQIDPEIKVLLSSGYSIDGEAAEILDRGCNGFIQKPFRVEPFSLKIREILEPSSGFPAEPL